LFAVDLTLTSYQWPFHDLDPFLLEEPFQSQGSTAYLTTLDILAQPRAHHPQAQLNPTSPGATGLEREEVPLNLEPGYVYNSIASTYTPGDRTSPAAHDQSREYSTSTPNSGPSGSQTEESLRQLNIQDGPSQGPPQGLQRRSTYAQVAALPSPDRLHPHYGQGPPSKKPIQLPMRSMARSVQASSRSLDVQSTTSTHRSGKRKRSPPPASQPEPSRQFKCQDPDCDKTFNTLSDLQYVATTYSDQPRHLLTSCP
jgi:hypothetical protein